MYVTEIIQVIYGADNIFWSRMKFLAGLSKSEKIQMFF